MNRVISGTNILTMVPIVMLAAALVFSSALLLVPHTANADITTGLVGHWTFDSTDTLSTIADVSGNANHGYFNGGATSSAKTIGVLGQALRFDGDNDYVQTSFNETLLPATITAWARVDSASDLDNCNGLVYARGTDVSGLDLGSCNDATRMGYTWNNDGSTWGWTGGPVIPIDKWFLAAVVVEASQATVYAYSADGLNSAVNTLSHTASDINDLEIGRNNFFDYGDVRARVDDVRIYDRALTADDIAELYSYRYPALSRPPNNLGLVGYWPFDEGTGTVAGDFSGNGNTGTLSGDTVWANGKRGKALDFDGTTDFVDVENISLAGTFTMSYWYYSEDNSTISTVIGEDSGTQFGGPKIGQNTGYFFVRLVSDTDNTIALPSANNWHHVAIVRDASDKVDLYVNGGAANRIFINSAQSGTYTVDKIAANGDGSQAFNGQIDDVRIYNRALNASEVAALARGGAARIGASSVDLARGSSLEQGLVGHWTFDGTDTLSTITDRSGGGRHGYFYGGATSSAKAIGILGQGMRFDGTDDYVRVSRFIPLESPTAFSFATWVKLDRFQTDNNFTGLIEYGKNGTTPNILVLGGCCGLNNRLRLSFGGDDIDGSVLELNTWYHIVGTTDGTTEYLYLNGEVDGQATSGFDAGDSTMGLYIGRSIWNDLAGRFLIGTMDDTRIYDRALTAAEVKQLYNLGQVKITQ